MPAAPWRSLVRSLSDAGYESPYLDRLRRRIDVTGSDTALETELVREMAAALGRAEDKVNAGLLRLELAGRALEDARTPAERTRCADEFESARMAALRARWELLVQREAVGIRRNQVLEELYPIPSRRRR